MKTRKRQVASKGDRLGWTPLKELKPVKFSFAHLKGRVLTLSDLETRCCKAAKIFLLP